MKRFRNCLPALLLAWPLATLQAQSSNPLLISSEERCAFNRVDDASLPLALEQCQEIAEQGDLQALYEMGELYYRGQRVERDAATALIWFEQASVQGHAAAQYRLGLMHAQGDGVPRNLTQAYIILKMAAVNGEDAAMDASDNLALQMNEQELALSSQILGTLFRNYLNQLREEQLNPPVAAPVIPETP
ncbi:MAG: tetratricopeptide repeat protein [Halopseudomonas yangmingensis]|uniref:Sel1 repeat-containing protein n=1 Tax=Halopseudomonas yangmingensis TaxID=1720063 RepID=A0A1I4T7Z6_9GAMM|nr:tetratricopeptide repeat protein [Halopseudomonas yangmingensis]SFM72826.1 hypothetical protein SAMN05216217_11352 [Halopseudomonas yangmingensis]